MWGITDRGASEMPPLRDVLDAFTLGKIPRQSEGTCQRDYMSHLSQECLWIPKDWRKSASGKRNVWQTFLCLSRAELQDDKWVNGRRQIKTHTHHWAAQIFPFFSPPVVSFFPLPVTPPCPNLPWVDPRAFHSSVNSYWMFCVKGAGEAGGGSPFRVCIQNSCQATDAVCCLSHLMGCA